MSEFSPFERRLAIMLSKYSFIKKIVKTCYIYFMRLFAINKDRAIFKYPIYSVYDEYESFFWLL